MPAISGTWRDTAIFYSAPTPLHVADPRHDVRGHEPSPGDFSYQAPPYPYTKPRGREDFGSQEVPDIRGFQLDQTPYVTTDGADWSMAYTDGADYDVPGGADVDLLQQTHRTHGLDRGASRKQNYSEKSLQFYDEKYLFFRVPGAGEEVADSIPQMAYGAHARALNSLTANNPPLESYLGKGFWPGTTEQAVVDRKFQARVIQRNDERAQTPNLPYFERNTPPARPGNMATSPFSGLQRMMSGVFKIALQRRTPDLPGDIESEMVMEDISSPVVGAEFNG